MRMPVDDFFNPAIDRNRCVGEDRGTAFKRGPPRAFIARDADRSTILGEGDQRQPPLVIDVEERMQAPGVEFGLRREEALIQGLGVGLAPLAFESQVVGGDHRPDEHWPAVPQGQDLFEFGRIPRGTGGNGGSLTE